MTFFFMFCTDCSRRLYFCMLIHGIFCIPKILCCHMVQIWLASSHHLLFVDHFSTLSRIVMKVSHIHMATGSFFEENQNIYILFLERYCYHSPCTCNILKIHDINFTGQMYSLIFGWDNKAIKLSVASWRICNLQLRPLFPLPYAASFEPFD